MVNMDNKDDLLKWLEKLKNAQKPIVVEGINDRSALVNIGIDPSLIIILDRPLFAVAERVAKMTKEVIILTDLDKAGKKLFITLKQDLTRLGVRIDSKYRTDLFRLSKLSHIEGIDTYFSKL
ncbi:hypothetical protein HQ545_00250 [Candidatus Woesearchaeota archaeon]|nr:hypothetical protein [Candidatus Woesearchaeota archaeon]